MLRKLNWLCFNFDNEKDPDYYEQFELVKNSTIWTDWMDAGVTFWSEKKKDGNELFQPSGTDIVVTFMRKGDDNEPNLNWCLTNSYMIMRE